ncbi:MAG: hypothetical protein A2289_07985 [Deltaproteobacteria bacterium RIFOXYA12_FULL_58_15]|nr:MAG: hypothetical protein A2289_07985 [Deltaproteobacteria bacterium RIFOXYA12_FULL_58_15]OGR10359.1 MAG: hypothetical protein A2341_22855 [Deltaproteobacteria bacterium RIFOXYB12_FULL_58_9]
MIRAGLLAFLALLSTACGDETAIMVKVDLQSYAVPLEVDLVHLQLTDNDEDMLGRNFLLEDNQTEPVLELIPGPRMQKRFTLVVFAFKGDQWVAESTPLEVAFADGELAQISIHIPR